MVRDKPESGVKLKKFQRKEIVDKIFNKISEALKEYAIPSSEKKLTKKIKKASKSFSKLLTLLKLSDPPWLPGYYL